MASARRSGWGSAYGRCGSRPRNAPVRSQTSSTSRRRRSDDGAAREDHPDCAAPGAVGVSFQYTAGVAGERFFSVLRTRGRFAVTRCPECGTTYLPPRIYCPRDFQDLTNRWDEVAPRGTVHSFTVLHRDLNGQPLDRPRLFGVVQIDATDGGP